MSSRPERRFRVSKQAWLPIFEKNWLFVWGGDEYGNTVFSVRISPKRHFDWTLNVPMRTHLLPSGISLDVEANTIRIDFILDDGVRIVRTDEVGRSLLANYAASGELVSIELLSIGALSHPDTARDLRTIVPEYVAVETERDVRDMAKRTGAAS